MGAYTTNPSRIPLPIAETESAQQGKSFRTWVEVISQKLVEPITPTESSPLSLSGKDVEALEATVKS